MRTASTVAAVTALTLAISGCASDEEEGPVGEPQQVDPELGDEDEPDEDQTGDETGGETEDSDNEETEEPEAEEETQEPEAEEETQEPEAEEGVWVMPEDHAQAEQLAAEQAEEIHAQVEREGHYPVHEPGIPEDPEEVALMAAAIASTHYPGVDWNYTQAQVRASFLYGASLAESDESTQIPEMPVPAGDESWTSAWECDAQPEVRVEMFEPSDTAHVPFAQVLAEYQWVGGDDDCDLIQPDFQYLYSIDVQPHRDTGDPSVQMINYDRQDIAEGESLFDD